jgi:outer membrane receptor protein involved in Fe transport
MPEKHRSTRRGLLSAALAALCGMQPAVGAEAGAQVVPQPRARAVASPDDVEIIVTARRRDETLLDVPLSVATYSADQLLGKGLASDFDISNFTIGFRTLQQTGRDIDRPTIRGMGNPATRGEPNASYFVDGVFVSGSISTATTSAVERVEILRGPQSAQFGRATFSGAINYVTKEPTNDFAGQFNSRAGTHDDYSIGGWYSGPIIEDRLLFVVSGNWSRYGGQWNNQLEAGDPGNPTLGIAPDPGAASWESEPRPDRLPFAVFLDDPPQQGDHSRLGSEETTDLLAKLVYRPAEGSELTLRYGYTKGDDTHFPSQIVPELNCFLPPDDYVPLPANIRSLEITPLRPGEQAWHRTTQGQFCGEFRAEGRIDRINLPDMRNGVTYFLPYANPADGVVPGQDPGTRRDQHRVLLGYTQDLDGYTLTARGSWNRDDFQQLFDLDHTQTRSVWGLFHFDNRRVIEDYSAELRLATPADRPVRSQLGVYWYDQDRENNQRSYVGPLVVFGYPNTTTAFPVPTFIDITNKAVFGSVDLDLSPAWTLTLEGRYGEDEKIISGGVLGNTCVRTGSPTPAEVPATFDNFTPRITLRFKPADDLTFYTLAAKGNKPGDYNTEFFRSGIDPCALLAGINGVASDPALSNPSLPELIVPPVNTKLAIVAEEEQWTYEVGAKASLLDRRVSANLSLYTIDWQNQGLFSTTQILQSTGTYLATTVIRNVGTSRVNGLELETSWRLTDNLTLAVNYGYTDSRYKKGFDPVTEASTGNGNLRNKRVTNVPEHTLILGAYASAPMAEGWDLFLSPDFAYNSKRYPGAGNLGWIDDQQLLNLRLGVQSARWTWTAYVRNLLNDDTPVAVLDFINFGLTDVPYTLNEFGNLTNDLDPRLFSINPSRGRDWGLEAQYRF